MLLFLVDSKDVNATDESLKRMNTMMKSIKSNKRVGDSYMHTMMREMHIREEGRESMLLSLIEAKLKKQKNISQIADELEQTEEYIKELIEKNKKID